MKCWSYNGFGELGLGDVANRGDNGGEMGDALPAIALGTRRTAVSLGHGARHVCAILDDGGIKCWGNNVNGALGLGDAVLRGDNPNEMGDNLPYVDLGTP